MTFQYSIRILYYMTTNIKLQTGDMLHCSRDTFLSRIIMWATNGEVSHTALVVENWGYTYVIDAQKEGIYPMPLEDWLTKYGYDEIEVARPIKDIDTKAFSVKAHSYVGKTGYDFVTLLIRHPWYILTGKWFKEEMKSKYMTCSEYVAKVFNIKFAFKQTPQDLLEYTKRLDGIEFVHHKFEYDLVE